MDYKKDNSKQNNTNNDNDNDNDNNNNVVVLARLLVPDDANLSRTNVHGGVTLHLMEQAGMISATKFFNSFKEHKYYQKHVSALVRFETMDFHQPIYVGELVSLKTNLLFTSKRSLLIKVIVVAENLLTGTKRITNTGMLWYVSYTKGITTGNNNNNKPQLVDTIPQLRIDLTNCDASTKKAYEMGQQLYETRKQLEEEEKQNIDNTNNSNISNNNTDNNNNNNNNNTVCACFKNTSKKCLCPTCRLNNNNNNNNNKNSNSNTKNKDNNNSTTTTVPIVVCRTIKESKQILSQVVLPSDCGVESKIAYGGFVMKLMDNAAGCTAFRHARTNVVTINVSSMDFINFVTLGDIITITATIQFVSLKSMEIYVICTKTNATIMVDNENNNNEIIVARGIFTFVALDNQTRKVIPVPSLQYQTEQEYELAYQRQIKYEAAKQARLLSCKK